MSFLVAVAAFVAAGLALLKLLRLDTRSASADAGLAWFLGTGYFAAVAPLLRFALGIPMSRVAAAAVMLTPTVAWAAFRLGGRGARAAATDSNGPRWLPRPLVLYVPIAAYVLVVTALVVLHGVNTPTHTDDAVRVRAFAPMLAFADAWSPEARTIFVMAGPLPTFAPALGWILGGTIDHFHVNYAVLADLLAILLVVVGLDSSRGRPERGWASAFAILSIPLFVYHCTSTYSDAVLAIRIGVAVFFGIAHAQSRAYEDLARAFLLLGIAALVKREGELVAAGPAAVFAVQVVTERFRGRIVPWATLACAAVPVAAGIAAKVAAVGLTNSFPMFDLVVAETGLSAVSTIPELMPDRRFAAARLFFEHGLLRSGNAGMIYWVLGATIVVRARALVRGDLGWPLAAVLVLLGEVAVSSILIVPQFTLDGSTVHRALLVASVPAAIWLAAALTGVALEPRSLRSE